MSSILDCVVERALPHVGGSALVGPPGEIHVEATWPKPSLRSGFQPFTLLTHEKQKALDIGAKDVDSRIKSSRDQYRPKVR